MLTNILENKTAYFSLEKKTQTKPPTSPIPPKRKWKIIAQGATGVVPWQFKAVTDTGCCDPGCLCQLPVPTSFLLSSLVCEDKQDLSSAPGFQASERDAMTSVSTWEQL